MEKKTNKSAISTTTEGSVYAKFGEKKNLSAAGKGKHIYKEKEVY